MSFVSPLWWWAMAGLAVPLAIHLLSRGRRQRVAIGSVRHLQGKETRALRRLRLTGFLQLFLRALLLAAVAVALAGPRWEETESRSGSGSWVLIDPEVLSMADDSSAEDNDFWRHLEAAREEADSIRLLAPGLPDLKNGQVWDGHADAWSLLKEADERAPSSASLQVFTLDRTERLRGRRPSLAREVDWWVLRESKPNRWIQRAVSTGDGFYVVTVGESDGSATRFRTYSWPEDGSPPEGSGLRRDMDENIVGLRLPDSHPEDDWVQIADESAALKLAMSAGPDRELDAWYLRRGLEAVGGYLGRELEWSDPDGASLDLEIRLGTEPSAGSGAAVVLIDGESVYENCEMRAYAASIPGQSWVRLERCSTDWGTDEEVGLWSDDWGRPFLSRRTGVSSAIHRLHGRFDSRWSSLVTSPALPRLLLDLLVPDDATQGGADSAFSDRRFTTGTERLPAKATTSAVPLSRQSETPESIAWILVALLVVLERWLSGKSS
jgi:hypothetical protein